MLASTSTPRRTLFNAHALQYWWSLFRIYANMRGGLVLAVLLLACCTLVIGTKKLQIGVKKRPETCDMKSKNGDRLSMHYTVSYDKKSYCN